MCVIVYVKLLQSCPPLCNPMDCNSPGSSVHGILHVRILEWLSCPLPGNLPHPGILEPTKNRTHISCFLNWQMGSLPLAPPGKPRYYFIPPKCFLSHDPR